jgi:release factor glutamine methyltransferase
LREASNQLESSGSETARLDAEVLLGHVLGVGRTTLLAAPEAIVSDAQSGQYGELVARRANGEPVAYIRGLKEFYGMAFTIDERALIPRPETELVVELALARIQDRLVNEPRPADGSPLLAWDVGTGSGAICIALAFECRRRGYGADVRFRATDLSADALSLAIENAVGHGVADQIDFATADLIGDDQRDAVDLVIANLPYIPSADIPALPVAASYEPVAALDGGPDGLTVIRRLLGELPAALKERGLALIEFGDGQRDRIVSAVDDSLLGWAVAIHDDLGGRPRVAEVTRPVP